MFLLSLTFRSQIFLERRQISKPEPAINRPTNPSRLGLSKQHPDPHEANIKAPEDGQVVLDDFDDRWPGYEEPVIIYH
jgi:hypothetical protein